jgi:hypothetical protein
MDYCGPLGIPHSKFLKWSDDDRNKAISHMLWKKKFCSRCGTDPSEWLDADGKTLEPPPFEAVTHVCHGCATLEEERATRPKDATSSKYQTYLVRYTGDVEEWQMRQSQLD